MKSLLFGFSNGRNAMMPMTLHDYFFFRPNSFDYELLYTLAYGIPLFDTYFFSKLYSLGNIDIVDLSLSRTC